jgi:hypothetical protein
LGILGRENWPLSILKQTTLNMKSIGKKRYFLISVKYELSTDSEHKFMSYVIQQHAFPNIPQIVHDVKTNIKDADKIFPVSVNQLSYHDFMDWQKGTEQHAQKTKIIKG